MSKRNRPQYFVSTDSIGFLGKAEQFIKLWKEYFENKTLDGVEIIAFKPLSRLSKLVSTLEKNKIPVLSFHGKTGGENRAACAARLLCDTPRRGSIACGADRGNRRRSGGGQGQYHGRGKDRTS